MATRRFALVLGLIYLVVGLAGFLPTFLATPPADAPPLTITALYGYLLHLFPVNVLHTVVHLLVGAAGLAAAGHTGRAVAYARTLAVVFAVLTVMGIIPGLNTVFGLLPLHGHDVWLHAVTALVSAYFGFVARPTDTGTTGSSTPRAR